jgi:hypothetical protein
LSALLFIVASYSLKYAMLDTLDMVDEGVTAASGETIASGSPH